MHEPVSWGCSYTIHPIHITVTSQSLQLKGRAGSASDYPLAATCYAAQMVQQQTSFMRLPDNRPASATPWNPLWMGECHVLSAKTFEGYVYRSFSAICSHLLHSQWFIYINNTSPWLAGCSADQPGTESSRCGVHMEKKHQNSQKPNQNNSHKPRWPPTKMVPSEMAPSNCSWPTAQNI